MRVVDEEQVLRCAELLQRVADVHQRAAAAALTGLGVSGSGSGLLWLLGGRGPLTMGAVALELSCDPSNVTLLAAGLERLGLVRRVADPQDGRRRLLELTDRGRGARAAMLSAVSDASPLSALPEDRFQALVDALRPLA